MRDELLTYYERELTFLRHMGAGFAEKYPKIASRLMLEPNRCDDPHVERLIEAFSFLAARVHLKIDDEFPEITQALLNVLYPHYIRPIPAMSVAELRLDAEQAGVTSAVTVPSGSTLFSRPVGGYPCKFRTCYETVLWPLAIAQAQWRTPDRLEPAVKSPESAAAVKLDLVCSPGVTFGALEIPKLRFYLSGDANLVYPLYELLLNGCTRILLRDPAPGARSRAITLPPSALRPAGFAEDEGVLPYPRRSFLAYRLLQEYFVFPEKFLFVDLTGLEALNGAGFQERLEIVFLLAPFDRMDWEQVLQVGIAEKTFRLGCSPIVNLFPHTADPILVEQTRYEYPVTPDARRPDSLEVFSVDEVMAINPGSGETVVFEPFYSHRHGEAPSKARTFWNARRRGADGRAEDASDVWLSIVDRSGSPAAPEYDTLTLRCTCSNRDLPSKLPFGDEAGDFELEGASPVRCIVALRKPTATLRVPAGKGALWRLISHLSLNYLSLVEGGKEALQEILRLYNFSGSVHLERQIAGIRSLQSRRHFARVISENGISFARGIRVEMDLDEENFVGGGAYLFSSVLEYFLGQYASLNSFSQLVISTAQRKEALKQWPPRAGQAILL